MNLRKYLRKSTCFGMTFLLMIMSVVVTPRDVQADVKLPFTYEGNVYQDIKSAPEETEDQVILKTLEANQSWIPDTEETLNSHWMGIARTAYASKFGSESLTRFMDIDKARMSLALYHSEDNFNYTRGAAAANNDKGYATSAEGESTKGPFAQALYASSAEGALDGVMEGIKDAARVIGETKEEQMNPQNIESYVVAPEGLRDTLRGISGAAAYSWYGNFIQEGTKDYCDSNYAAIGIIYSNFRLTPVLPDDIGIVVTGADPTTGTDKEETGVFNATGSEIDVSQSLEESHADTARNSISKTKTLSFSEGLSISHTASVGLNIEGIINASAETTTTASFSAEQALETAWSNEKEISDSNTITRTVGLKLPAYTKVNLKQEKTSWDTKVTYECPVYVTYDVTVIGFCRDPGANNWRQPKAEVICTLKNDAVKDFLKRFVLTGSASDPDLVNWSIGFKNMYYSNAATDLANVLIGANFGAYTLDTEFTANFKRGTEIYKRLSTYRPCILTGGTLNYTRQGTAYTIDGIVPYYPLTQVKTGDTKSYSMQAGEELHVEQIPLYGYNTYDGDFYGFQARKGSWKMLDSNGNEVTDNNVATFEEDGVTGYHYLKGKGEGKVYLRYTPDKSKYTKDMVSDSAVITIPVKIQGEPIPEKKYSIRASGNLIVNTGDMVDLNTADGIKVSVVDESGNVLTNILDWEVKDGDSGLVIGNGGQLKAAKDGTYQIRPIYELDGNKIVASHWLTVTAKTKTNYIGMTPEKDKLSAIGGKVTFRIFGTNLKDGIQVRSGKIRGWTTGSSTNQSVTLEFPVNKNKKVDRVYNMEYSLDGNNFNKTTASIRVEHVKKARIKKVEKKTARKVYVKWYRDTKASGYQIQTAVNKKFTKESKKAWMNSYKKTSTTVKKLANKSCYIRVRTYQLDGRDRIYGDWSKVIKVNK